MTKIVLLDVDNSLVFDFSIPVNPKKINQKLLADLKRRGLTHLHLFTDMDLTAEGILQRVELVEFLNKDGFTVHGVITPSDLLFKEDLNNLPATLQEAFGNNKPGKAFNKALKAFIANAGALPDTFTARSTEIRNILYSIRDHLKLYPHIKAFMLLQYLHHCSLEVQKIVLVDDQPAVIKSVRIVCEQLNQSLIDIIHVRSQGEHCYYSSQLAAKGKTIEASNFAPAIMLHTLTREISRLTETQSLKPSKDCEEEISRLQEAKKIMLNFDATTVEGLKLLLPFFQDSTTLGPHIHLHLNRLCNNYLGGPPLKLASRLDIQRVLQQISRFRHASKPDEMKADELELRLVYALRNGCEDVTKDFLINRIEPFISPYIEPIRSSFWDEEVAFMDRNQDYSSNRSDTEAERGIPSTPNYGPMPPLDESEEPEHLEDEFSEGSKKLESQDQAAAIPDKKPVQASNYAGNFWQAPNTGLACIESYTETEPGEPIAATAPTGI